MALMDELRSEVDPHKWEVINDWDDLLLKKHPLTWAPRKKDTKLRMSWSLFKNGLNCARSATRTVFPERFGITSESLKFTESIASIRGNLVQTLLEHAYCHNYFILDPTPLVRAFQASWRWGVKFYNPLKTMTPKELNEVRDEIFFMLPKILATMNREGLWAKRQEVEKPLWWDMPSMPGVRLTGKADFVLQDPGKNWLVDGKFVNNPTYLDARQLTFYAFILQKMTGKLPEKAFFWLYPQDEVIDHSDECLTTAALFSVHQDAAKVARQIQEFDDTPSPSAYKCRYCAFRSTCDVAQATT